MATTRFFIYSNIPHSGKGWTLAVCAVGRRDADTYVRHVHRGGKFSHAVVNGGSVKADCGAVTSAAQEVIHENLERWLNESE